MKKVIDPIDITQIKQLHQQAALARENSYSPYSNFKVGAALLSNDLQIFSGCNVENASYGATVCAERVALFKAVSEGCSLIRGVYVLTQSTHPSPPCGMCLQVLFEFTQPETPVILGNLNGAQIIRPMKEFGPYLFGSDFLRSNPTKNSIP